MSLSNIRRRVHEAAQPAVPEPQGPGRCVANGCPCIGSVLVEGGRWCCTSHGFAASDNWPRITEGLNEHRWLLEFTAEVQKMHRRHEDWRAFAIQFWEGQDDYCKPDPREGVIPYFNRMKGELDYRLGLCKRPAPRLPQEAPVGRRRFGNVASKVAA